MIRRQLRRMLEAPLKRLLGDAENEAVMMADNPRYARYRIGKGSYGAPRVVPCPSGATLSIGRYCSIAEGVTIMLGSEHRPDWVTTYPFNVLAPGARSYAGHPRSKGDVVIGNDVWIGFEALLLSGLTIGDGAVIAARSVVARSVEPYEIVGGNPARHIRHRFPDQTRAALQRLRWWDWPEERIAEAWPLLLSNDLTAFLSRYGADEG
jgi:acetyltransferase-like isoleucine patch superfamily enzyme